MEKTVNANALAILNALKANEGKVLTFAEIAAIAGVEAKTGYLTGTKALAKAEKLAIVKIEDGAEYTVETVATYATGLKVAKTKTVKADGYTLKVAD